MDRIARAWILRAQDATYADRVAPAVHERLEVCPDTVSIVPAFPNSVGPIWASPRRICLELEIYTDVSPTNHTDVEQVPLPNGCATAAERAQEGRA